MDADETAAAIALAREHGIELEPGSLRGNEAGLDFRVVLATATDGVAWVLRIPRRPEVAAKAGAEAAILDLVRPRLAVAVPDWRVRTERLIAYPALPGEPGLTIDGATGELCWRLDVASTRYAESFGGFLAALHRIGVDAARIAGVPVDDPAAVRARWRADVERVAAGFRVAPALLDRWRAWLADDALWPSWSVLTHGELYPAHVLIDGDDQVTGVIDWTTARVGDPARDFAFQRAMASPAVFERTVEAYVAAGGRVWPRLADHAAELWAASPVAYGLFALETGDPQHHAAAAAQLDPPAG